MKVVMKRVYFKPTMRAIEIKTSKIICASDKKLSIPKKPGTVTPGDPNDDFEEEVEFD